MHMGHSVYTRRCRRRRRGTSSVRRACVSTVDMTLAPNADVLCGQHEAGTQKQRKITK